MTRASLTSQPMGVAFSGPTPDLLPQCAVRRHRRRHEVAASTAVRARVGPSVKVPSRACRRSEHRRLPPPPSQRSRLDAWPVVAGRSPVARLLRRWTVRPLPCRVLGITCREEQPWWRICHAVPTIAPPHAAKSRRPRARANVARPSAAATTATRATGWPQRPAASRRWRWKFTWVTPPASLSARSTVLTPTRRRPSRGAWRSSRRPAGSSAAPCAASRTAP
mmetsp:Transcript_36816/g.113604  ORF Transcript_36816/g.113604 Transcript_36816/m.113604 type:complete len:222 (+) Transcript_36816:357-1022(+)